MQCQACDELSVIASDAIACICIALILCEMSSRRAKAHKACFLQASWRIYPHFRPSLKGPQKEAILPPIYGGFLGGPPFLGGVRPGAVRKAFSGIPLLSPPRLRQVLAHPAQEPDRRKSSKEGDFWGLMGNPSIKPQKTASQSPALKSSTGEQRRLTHLGGSNRCG